MKTDLALNNLRRLIYHKTQTTNQPTQTPWWGWVFDFHYSRYILWGQSKQMFFMCVHWLILAENFFIWEKSNMSEWRISFSLFKSFAARSFLFSFRACDENCPFLILNDNLRMSSCTTCPMKNTDIPPPHTFLSMDLIDLLGSLTIMDWVLQSNPGFFDYQNS